MNQLQHDSKYLTAMQGAEDRQRSFVDQHSSAIVPILADLKQAGFPVESLDELRRGGAPYEAAIPVLLTWLPLVECESVKESVVRALSVPWAKPIAAFSLLREFRTLPVSQATNAGVKWAIGNALSLVASDSVFPEIVELVKNRQHGKSREMLTLTLANMKNPAAIDVLVELLEDPEVAGYAVMALGKLKAIKAIVPIQSFLTHPQLWIRKEAKKALAKLDSQLKTGLAS